MKSGGGRIHKVMGGDREVICGCWGDDREMCVGRRVHWLAR